MVEGALGFLSPAPRPGRQEPRSPGPREPAVSFACCSALTASGRAVVVASPAPLAAKGQGLGNWGPERPPSPGDLGAWCPAHGEHPARFPLLTLLIRSHPCIPSPSFTDRNARPHRLPRRVGRAGIPSGTWAGMPCWFLCPTRTRIHIGSDLAAADTGAAGEGDGSKGKESAVGVQAPVLRNLGGLPGPCHLLLPSFPKPACTMSVSSGEMGPSLTQEILSHLGLVNKPAAWGTLGTLRTFLSFSVDKDVQRLLRAITGRGVDQGAILEVLTNRSREQRQLISQAFRERTQQDLLKSLRVALSGNLEWIVVALLQPLAQSDAQELRKALKGSGSAEDVAVEILATRAPPQLQECLAAYKHSFQVDAEEDIKSETSSILQDLLLALAKGGRDSYSGIIDYNLAEQDVQALRQVEGPWVPIFTQRNPEHLLRVCDLYQWRTGRALEEAVRDRFHGDAQVALLSLASVVRNTPLYFADKLHRALQETEPNYQVLMRILVSRNETDLLSIRAEFKKKFGESLYSSLQRAVKGDCRPALLALCRAEDL
ncbi:annexin A9 isoform X2 [Heterocephalus glaber]|uniref:Annexin n=2 Tax=Heterocephalus glaber TaxID=10181 RepID=A0AAX6PKN7_HETGA|nr:annexin A9 isoform X2 [Heterocephalus glaber]